MLPKTDAHDALRRRFARRPVAEIDDLLALLHTRSRMSVFRRLREVGYLSSFTHSGRYYTLLDIPRFDEHGLWFTGPVGFSHLGTLKDTVPALVTDSPAGVTQSDLEGLLRIRVQNVLTQLVSEGRIERRRRGRTSLYLSPDQERAAAQIARREERTGPSPVPDTVVLEVLVEVARASGMTLGTRTLTARLLARGVQVVESTVREVCDRYGIRPEKKTVD